MNAIPPAAVVDVIGDSHVGDVARGEGLAPWLMQQFRANGWVPGRIVSKPGWSTAKYVREGNVTGIVRRAQPAAVVLIVLGTNDAGYSAAQYMADVRELGRQAGSAGAHVIWWGPPAVIRSAIAVGVSQAADLQRQALQGTGIDWIDLRPPTPAGEFRDEVHLTPHGYSVLASSAVEAMKGGASNITKYVLLGLGLAILAALLWPPSAAPPPQPTVA